MESLHRHQTISSFWLPVELWLHIIGFLRSDPYALLACCLTCKSFRDPADVWLEKLYGLSIDPSDYADIDRFQDWIRLQPDRVYCVSRITLRVDFQSESPLPVALPATLHGLTRRLVNIYDLTFDHVPHADLVHWSVWQQFGHAFPKVKYLHLYDIQFPSFVDFTRLLTSFRVTGLEQLHVGEISWILQPEVVPHSPPRRPFKQVLQVRLRLADGWGHDKWGHDGLRRMRTFLEWVLPRGGVVPGYDFCVWPLNILGVSSSILSSDVGVLETIHTSLRHLIFSCNHLWENYFQFDWRVWRSKHRAYLNERLSHSTCAYQMFYPSTFGVCN